MDSLETATTSNANIKVLKLTNKYLCDSIHTKLNNSGTTGSQILLVNDVNVGIFKPFRYDYTQTKRQKVTSYLKKNTVGQECYLNKENPGFGELVAYLFEQSINKSEMMIPPIKVIEYNKVSSFGATTYTTSMLGTLQTWLDDKYKEAKTYKKILLDKHKTYTEHELILFQKMAILDYLIGNLDRHDSNWMVKISEDNTIEDIKLIDNANCFPSIQPKKISPGSRNQYRWHKYPISKEKFHKDILYKFNIDNKNIDGFISKIKDIEKILCFDSTKSYFDNKTLHLFKLRLNVINKIFKNVINFSPNILNKFKTVSEMNSFINKKSSTKT